MDESALAQLLLHSVDDSMTSIAASWSPTAIAAGGGQRNHNE
jgi:hypothetical protein